MSIERIEASLNSDIGLRRKDNQDSAFIGHGVYVVCDGMGGGKDGKRASSTVAERFARLADRPTRDLDMLDDTLLLAQQDVLRLGEELGGVSAPPSAACCCRHASRTELAPLTSVATSSTWAIRAPTICVPTRPVPGWRIR